jgi:DNA topoisomerase-1
MPRLRRVSVSQPGLTRRRSGKGFTYLDATGKRITDPAVLDRCRELVVPPAWKDVWICPYPNGHVQAYGIDAAGRGQYLYHPQWRARRDRAKHDHALAVGARLPAAREEVDRDLQRPGMPREKALAVVFRLLDVGLFRIGGETYAAKNDSHGVTTLLRSHVTARRDGSVRFQFPAKSGKNQDIVVEDPDVHAAVRTFLRRRDASDRLVAWRGPGTPAQWHTVSSADVSGYVKERLGSDASAKVFRTWHATVLAAQLLEAVGPPPASERKRRTAVSGVVRAVADELGNTPTVARASYIDPRLFDHWERGSTIPPCSTRADAEAAVITLLGDGS